MLKKAIALGAAVLILVAAIIVVRAVSLTSRQPGLEPPVTVAVDADGAARRLARGLTFQTISYLPPAPIDRQAFLDLHTYIEETYPLVHQSLTRETVADLSLLYTWEGSDPELSPAVFLAHLDVVPVIPGTEADWEQPPFAGVVDSDYVWGRGAMDDKSGVFALLEAVEAHLADGYRPARTIYLAFGHDEELGGYTGARKIAALLAARDSRELAIVLDEGGAVIGGFDRFFDRPIALIGITEKGYVSLRLRVEGAGGHSSAPPPNTNVGILARAITRLEDDPFPVRLDATTRQGLAYLTPEMPFVPRLLFANLWLFEPVVTRWMAGNQVAAAMVRTTTAATMFSAGIKDNVLPITATAVVNHRIAHGETIDSVVERVNRVIADERVVVTLADEAAAQDPSPVSNTDGPAFAALLKTIRQTMSDSEPIIAPYLLIGGTDSKYYSERSSNVFRFAGMQLDIGDFGRAHGTDERIEISSYAAGIGFLRQLMRNLDGI